MLSEQQALVRASELFGAERIAKVWDSGEFWFVLLHDDNRTHLLTYAGLLLCTEQHPDCMERIKPVQEKVPAPFTFNILAAIESLEKSVQELHQRDLFTTNDNHAFAMLLQGLADALKAALSPGDEE